MGIPYVGPTPSAANHLIVKSQLDALAGLIPPPQQHTDRGLWAGLTGYAVGDVVTYDSIRYLCASAHTSAVTFSGAGSTWIPTTLVLPRVSVWRSTVLSIPNASDTLVSWNQADYDVNYGTAQWDSNGIIIRVSGLYLVEGHFIFEDGNATGRRAIKLTKNNTANAGTFASTITNANSWDNVLSTSRQVRLNAGDIIRMLVTQDKGSAMNSVVLKWNDVRPRIVASYLAPL